MQREAIAIMIPMDLSGVMAVNFIHEYNKVVCGFSEILGFCNAPPFFNRSEKDVFMKRVVGIYSSLKAQRIEGGAFYVYAHHIPHDTFLASVAWNDTHPDFKIEIISDCGYDPAAQLATLIETLKARTKEPDKREKETYEEMWKGMEACVEWIKTFPREGLLVLNTISVLQFLKAANLDELKEFIEPRPKDFITFLMTYGIDAFSGDADACLLNYNSTRKRYETFVLGESMTQ